MNEVLAKLRDERVSRRTPNNPEPSSLLPFQAPFQAAPEASKEPHDYGVLVLIPFGSWRENDKTRSFFAKPHAEEQSFTGQAKSGTGMDFGFGDKVLHIALSNALTYLPSFDNLVFVARRHTTSKFR